MKRRILTFRNCLTLARGLLTGSLCLVGMSEDAWATCGDYLMIPHQDVVSSDTHGSNPVSNRRESDVLDPHGRNDGERPSSPCQGPGCRGEQPVPVPHAPFSLERQTDDAYAGRLRMIPSPEVRRLPLSSPKLTSSDEREPLERPPKQPACC